MELAVMENIHHSLLEVVEEEATEVEFPAAIIVMLVGKQLLTVDLRTSQDTKAVQTIHI